MPVEKEATEVASLFHRPDAATIGLQEAQKSLVEFIDKMVNDVPQRQLCFVGNDAVGRMNPYITICQPPIDLKDFAAFRVCGGFDKSYKLGGFQSREEWVGHRICDLGNVSTTRDDMVCAREIIQYAWPDSGALPGIMRVAGSTAETFHVTITLPLEVDGKLCFVSSGIELHEYPNNARGSEFNRAMMYLDTFKRSILPSACLLKFVTATLREYICVDYPRKFLWHCQFPVWFLDFKDGAFQCVKSPYSPPCKCCQAVTTLDPTLRTRKLINLIWVNSLSDKFIADLERILNDIQAKVRLRRVPTPQERYARNPYLAGQKQPKEAKMIGCHGADESGGSTGEEYSKCANCARFIPEGFSTSPSPGFPVGASSSSSTQTSIKESPPGYRTCEDCRPSVFTRPALGHNKNITTTRGEERPSSQQQHNTFASSTKNPTPGVMTARTAPMFGTPMAPHARAHIPNPRTQELIPRVGTQHQPSVGKEPKTPIWAPPLTSSSGDKNQAHQASTTVGKRDARSNGLKEEQIGDTRICSTLGALSGSRLQSGSQMFTPNNAASSRVDSRAADTSAGPTGAIVEGSSAATTRDMVEQPGPFLKIGDKVELHSFANAYWLQGLKATVSNVFAERRHRGKGSRVRAQIVYDEPTLTSEQGYPMVVPIQNLRLQPKGPM